MHACARAMFVFLDICISLIRLYIKRYTKGLYVYEMIINHTIKYVKLFFRCIKFSYLNKLLNIIVYIKMNIIWYQLKIVISTRCKSNEKHMIKMKSFK